MKAGRLAVNIVTVLVFALLLGGCATAPRRMGRFDVKVTLSEAMTDSTGMLPSVEVHLLALDTIRGKALQDESMSQYWNPNRPKDDYVKYIMHFGEGHPHSNVLKAVDPVWNQWDREGASWLFIMADLPGVYEDKENVKDSRRMILPLAPSRWQYSVINVKIEPNGIFCLTPRQ